MPAPRPEVATASMGASHATDQIWACGLVPVIELPRPDAAKPLAETLLDAGITVVEFTFRTAGAPEAIETVRREHPGMLVGAGTVLDREDAARALDAGAQFVVSPGTNAKVVDFVLGRRGLMFPGVATPSEIEANLERGISDMKFFPAPAFGGPVWLKAMAGPYRRARFIPTGGVTPANLGDYLGLANVLACGGSWLAPRTAMERGTYGDIARIVRDAVAIVRAVRPAEST